jgi:hypothetical protein
MCLHNRTAMQLVDNGGGGMVVYVGGTQGTLPMGVLGSQTSGPSYPNSCMPNSSNTYPQNLPILPKPIMHVALTS